MNNPAKMPVSHTISMLQEKPGGVKAFPSENRLPSLVIVRTGEVFPRRTVSAASDNAA